MQLGLNVCWIKFVILIYEWKIMSDFHAKNNYVIKLQDD